MTTQSRTTELEAINTILSTIGEAPLNTLTGSLPVDGTIAKNVLSEVAREVQSQGWHFNTHINVTLARDTDNKLPIATNVVRVELDPRKYSKGQYDIVQRDSFLYNLAENKDTFDINFEKKSGNSYFDDSVLKAILKSKPFPPFPDIYSPQEEEIVIRFAPENVRS